jgi:hypothetical protein
VVDPAGRRAQAARAIQQFRLNVQLSRQERPKQLDERVLFFRQRSLFARWARGVHQLQLRLRAAAVFYDQRLMAKFLGAWLGVYAASRERRIREWALEAGSRFLQRFVARQALTKWSENAASVPWTSTATTTTRPAAGSSLMYDPMSRRRQLDALRRDMDSPPQRILPSPAAQARQLLTPSLLPVAIPHDAATTAEARALVAPQLLPVHSPYSTPSPVASSRSTDAESPACLLSSSPPRAGIQPFAITGKQLGLRDALHQPQSQPLNLEFNPTVPIAPSRRPVTAVPACTSVTGVSYVHVPVPAPSPHRSRGNLVTPPAHAPPPPLAAFTSPEFSASFSSPLPLSSPPAATTAPARAAATPEHMWAMATHHVAAQAKPTLLPQVPTTSPYQMLRVPNAVDKAASEPVSGLIRKRIKTVGPATASASKVTASSAVPPSAAAMAFALRHMSAPAVAPSTKATGPRDKHMRGPSAAETSVDVLSDALRRVLAADPGLKRSLAAGLQTYMESSAGENLAPSNARAGSADVAKTKTKSKTSKTKKTGKTKVGVVSAPKTQVAASSRSRAGSADATSAKNSTSVTRKQSFRPA